MSHTFRKTVFLICLVTQPTLQGQQSIKRPPQQIRQASNDVVAYRSPARVTAGVKLRENTHSSYRLGFLGGMNFAYGVSDPAQPGTTRNAASFSLLYEQALGGIWYLEPELSYTQKGVRTSVYQIGSYNVTGNVKLDYLEVPVFLKTKFSLAGPSLKLYAMVGPSAAIAVKREVEVMDIVSVDLSSRFTNSDFLAVAATGVEYTLSKAASAILQFRYAAGLVDIDTTDNKYYTRTTSILMGFSFGF